MMLARLVVVLLITTSIVVAEPAASDRTLHEPALDLSAWEEHGIKVASSVQVRAGLDPASGDGSVCVRYINGHRNGAVGGVETQGQYAHMNFRDTIPIPFEAPKKLLMPCAGTVDAVAESVSKIFNLVGCIRREGTLAGQNLAYKS